MLVERHQKGLYNFLLQRVRSSEEAEDLTQESFVRAWRRLATYRDQWRFSTWLYAVARSAAADRARTRRELTQSEHAEPSYHADPAGELGAREEGENLWRLAAAVLSEEQRSALWLFYAEERSAAEIGRVLGKSAIAVRVMLFRARGILARHLERNATLSGAVEGARPRLETLSP
ncbi:MAG: sigma-70 family RNA polymerase sigma factor [Planctomycetes bacterium]|nr:sigma-70 family RNA polymerase sigma factor [Planctomycetota bacterium]